MYIVMIEDHVVGLFLTHSEAMDVAKDVDGYIRFREVGKVHLPN